MQFSAKILTGQQKINGISKIWSTRNNGILENIFVPRERGNRNMQFESKVLHRKQN